jgi:hypothetical protein
MPKLRDGVIKRGGSWSYVIRVPDPATGVSKPRWVGGFDTEETAKAARDKARVRARNGQYVNRSTSLLQTRCHLLSRAEAFIAAAASRRFSAGRRWRRP